EPAVAEVIGPVLKWASFSEHTKHVLAFGISFALSTSLHIIIGEQAPKNWAILAADRVLPVLVLPLVLFTYLFFPAIWALNWATNAVLRATGVEVREASHGGLPHTAEELRTLLDQAIEQGTIAKSSEDILTS